MMTDATMLDLRTNPPGLQSTGLFACNAPPESAYAIADVVCHGVGGDGVENRGWETHGRTAGVSTFIPRARHIR